jgi:hypothetical protein
MAFIVVGAVATIAAVIGATPGTGGLLLVVAGVLSLTGTALKGRRLLTPSFWLVPIGLVAPLVFMAVFVSSGYYTVIEVAATFATLGFGLAVAIVLAGRLLLDRLSELKVSSVHIWLVIGIATASVAGAFGWAFLVASGTIYSTVLGAVPFGVFGLVILIALWRWLGGDSIGPFIIGLLSPALMGLAFLIVAATAVFGMFEIRPPGQSSNYFLESFAALGVCSLVFAFLTILPPARRDMRPHRLLQSSWPNEVR